MSDLIRLSRRQLLASGGKAAALTAAIGIAPSFIRPGRAFAADALSPGMIGGPTGFNGAERYQYGPDTPEGRAVEAAKALKASGADRIVLGLSDGSIGQLTQPFPAGAPSIKDLWEKETGITLDIVGVPNGQEFTKTMQDISTKGGAYDIYAVEWNRLGDLAAHLGQRLGDGLDGGGQRALVRGGQLRVEPEARGVGVGAVGVHQLVQRGEGVADLGGECRVDLLQRRGQLGEGLLGALVVVGEVEQVDVRVPLLLAGDLAAGHLVEQFLRAVGELGGLVLQPGAQLLEPLDVGHELVPEGAHALERVLLEQRELDAVETAPLRERNVAGTRPSIRVARLSSSVACSGPCTTRSS